MMHAGIYCMCCSEPNQTRRGGGSWWQDWLVGLYGAGTGLDGAVLVGGIQSEGWRCSCWPHPRNEDTAASASPLSSLVFHRVRSRIRLGYTRLPYQLVYL